MIELLTSVTIVILVASLAFTLSGPARDQVSVAWTKSNLKQLYIATQLYQTSQGLSGEFGTTHEMGLPDTFHSDFAILRELRPPRALDHKSHPLGTGYFVYFIPPEKDGLTPRWSEYTKRFQYESVLYADPFNNPSGTPLVDGAYIRRRVIAVNLSGSLLDRHGYGDWTDRMWWHQTK